MIFKSEDFHKNQPLTPPGGELNPGIIKFIILNNCRVNNHYPIPHRSSIGRYIFITMTLSCATKSFYRAAMSSPDDAT